MNPVWQVIVLYEGFVKLEKRHVKPAAQMLADSFSEDPFFSYLFPDAASRKYSLFLVYQTILPHFIARGEVYATSEEIEGLFALEWSGDERTGLSSVWAVVKSIWRVLRLAWHIPLIRTLKRALAIKEPSLAVRHFYEVYQPHIYIGFIAVGRRHRGRGLMSGMMRAILEEADRNEVYCVLDTESETNVEIYRHFGFRLDQSVEAVPGALTYYMMVYDSQSRDAQQ